MELRNRTECWVYGILSTLGQVFKGEREERNYIDVMKISFGKLLPSSFIFIPVSQTWMGFPGGPAVENPSTLRETPETWVRSLCGEDLLEEGMAIHSSILAWRIPWTQDPGGLTVQWVAKSRTQLKRLSMHTHVSDLNTKHLPLILGVLRISFQCCSKESSSTS